jgi:uncharacterized protein (DUF305 family)
VRGRRALAALAVLLALGGCSSDSAGPGSAVVSGGGLSAQYGTPTEGSVEAGFARDMSVHHAQAVAMAEQIRSRTTDPDLRILADDIALGQQGQIGIMTGWLNEWGLNVTSTAPPMEWIRADNVLGGGSGGTMAGMEGMGGMTDMTLLPDGRMPGMATRPQVTALGTLPIAEAEVSFLQLMIAHHTAGIEMAQAALARTDRPNVVQLATGIVNGQQSEIEQMTDMLAKRGATP